MLFVRFLPPTLFFYFKLCYNMFFRLNTIPHPILPTQIPLTFY
nr:MAG TPA: hypothetical protein [Bacteriophage sp.]